MSKIKRLFRVFKFKSKEPPLPILIISKDSKNKEYDSIEEAIKELEKDPNVPIEKIIALKSSIKKLKNNTTIIIKDGEIAE